MIYPDTSVLIAAAVHEPRTDDVLSLLATGETFASSGWTLVEVASALAIKQRTKQISATDRARALAGIRALITSGFIRLPIDQGDFSTATRFIEESRVPLRGGDALHLAIGATHRATIWTLDRHMAEASVGLGVDARLL